MSATHGSTRPLVDVRLEALSTRGGRPPGVYEVGVHVRYGEFFTFLGPPKSGKSDVLRALAGFLPMASGRVLVDGQDICWLPRIMAGPLVIGRKAASERRGLECERVYCSVGYMSVDVFV